MLHEYWLQYVAMIGLLLFTYLIITQVNGFCNNSFERLPKKEQSIYLEIRMLDSREANGTYHIAQQAER